MRGEEDLKSAQRRPKRQRFRMSEDEDINFDASASRYECPGWTRGNIDRILNVKYKRYDRSPSRPLSRVWNSKFTPAPATRHELCAFQASTENISIWELVNHGALWLLAVLRLRNTLTYLLSLLTYNSGAKMKFRGCYCYQRRG